MRSLAVAVLIGACGGSSLAPDGGTADATVVDDIDANIDAPWSVGMIKLTARNAFSSATNGSLAAANTSVIFTDATLQTQVVVTDAMGLASATVTGPTTITHVHDVNSTVEEVTTIFGAVPGDDLLIERINRNLSPRASITVSYTAAPNTSYSACTTCGCSASGTPAIAPMYDYCQSNPANVVLLAFQGNTITYATGSTAYDPSTGGAITLAPSLASQPYTGTFTTIPPEVSRILLDFNAGTQSRDELFAAGTAATLNVQGWQGLPARFVAFLSRSDGAHQTVIEEVTTSTTDFTLDGASTLLPWLGLATYLPTTHTFRAPALPGAVDPDLFIGTFVYGAANNKTVIWTIIASGPRDFVLPQIPTSIADLTPWSNEGKYGSVYALAGDGINGFAEARQDPFALWRRMYMHASGRLVVSQAAYTSTTLLP